MTTLYRRDVTGMRVRVTRDDDDTAKYIRYTVSVSYNDCSVAELHDPHELMLDTVHRALVRFVAAQANHATAGEFVDISLELPAQAESIIENDPEFKRLEDSV